MAVTIKCPDCGHTEQSADGESKICPQCEGTMAAPPKKKYQAKSSSLEDEERTKKKSKSRDDDDDRPKKKARPRDEDEDEADEQPKAKKKAAAMTLDDDEEDEKGDGQRNGKAAKQLGLDPGFGNRELMKQVKDELSRGEVLHYACRPSPKIAKMRGLFAAAGGLFFCLIGVGVATLMLTTMKDKVPIFAVLIPGAFVLIGLGIAIFAPIMSNRQARLGWYAVTDRRAIVFHVSLWGKSGHAETYGPGELRKMRVERSFWLKGGGDLIFKTIITQHTSTSRDAHGRTRTSTSTSKQHFGFLGIADVKDVETLVHEVLLSRGRDDDDD